MLLGQDCHNLWGGNSNGTGECWNDDWRIEQISKKIAACGAISSHGTFLQGFVYGKFYCEPFQE